ncbi:unnamed protein product [Amoebophrya sp. A25]|nr:unnamed protein product [Amoebophrya sp. A25]|eukprot:GSA25T00008116001.1
MSSAPSALELQRQRFQAAEQQDGVRFSWNIWPPSRIDATRIVLPLGCVYTPLRQKMARVVSYEPLMCGGGTWSSRANFGRQSDDRKNECDGALNPFCKVDFRTKHWTCNFCGRLNQFPGFYAERISEQALPLECQLSSIEYLLPQVAHQGGTGSIHTRCPHLRFRAGRRSEQRRG